MPVAKFGITTGLLKDKEYFYLVSCGSTSAKVILEQRYRRDSVETLKIARHVKKIEARGIKFNSWYDELEIFDVMAALITPKNKCMNMPLKALINPYINKSLNEKLSMLYWQDILEKFEYKIRSNHLHIGKILFTSADINKIKFSIVWLNHIMQFPRSLKVECMLLSRDARHEFLARGPSGLQSISKGNKIYLRKLFNSMDELMSSDFFNKASLEFSDVWFKKFTSTDRLKLLKAIEVLYYSGQKSYGNFPIFYLFNKDINLDISKIEWLYQIGYTKIKDLSFVCNENKKLLDNEKTFNILYESFGKYKA